MTKFICLFVGCLLASLAHASLGSNSSVLDKESQALHATVAPRTEMTSYTMHEISNPHRTVREYSDHSGVVFAVTWQGRNSPDFKVVFGKYFSEFHATDIQTPVNRLNPLRRVTSDHLVVVQGGSMGHVFGRAYIVQMVPAGVTASSLK